MAQLIIFFVSLKAGAGCSQIVAPRDQIQSLQSDAAVALMSKMTRAPVAEMSGAKPRTCLRMEIKPRISLVDLDALHLTSFHPQTFCYWNQKCLFSRHVRQLELMKVVFLSWAHGRRVQVITWCSLHARLSRWTGNAESKLASCPLNMPSAAKLLPPCVSDQRAAYCCFLLFKNTLWSPKTSCCSNTASGLTARLGRSWSALRTNRTH